MNALKAGKQFLKLAWFRKPVFKVALALFLLVFIAVSGLTLYY